MKKLHTFGLWERPQASLLKTVLAKEGIACLLKNVDLAVAMGEIPMTECFPELWVIDEEMFPRAKLLLDGWLNSAGSDAGPWQCPTCQEWLEGHFGACWSCGRERE
ncbi:MAG: hypothetical protein C0619_11590 [Desulfuromonas sp.]|jgi:hypothetical protein|nr:MAG: hypothetical protein C0619_11590 [Desulfuromonas sp.]